MERSAAVPVSVPIKRRVASMFRKLLTLVAAATACITLASCVSEGGGYSTYDRSYTRYDGPRHVYRDDRRYRDSDQRRYDRSDARRDDHRDRRDWDRNDRRRSDDRDRGNYRSNNRDGNEPIILPPRR